MLFLLDFIYTVKTICASTIVNVQYTMQNVIISWFDYKHWHLGHFLVGTGHCRDCEKVARQRYVCVCVSVCVRARVCVCVCVWWGVFVAICLQLPYLSSKVTQVAAEDCLGKTMTLFVQFNWGKTRADLFLTQTKWRPEESKHSSVYYMYM